jgi:hypothetical protein
MYKVYNILYKVKYYLILIVRMWWVDSIKIDLREVGWDGGDLIDLAQDWDQWRALVRTVMNLRVP